ncbi:MAG: glycosyltransferase family 2 protein, partial [Saprospiraceae bacterium]
MPAITVIMPVYNTSKYLHESIHSILHQSFTDFEFIIINDGSTDTSEEIILSYTDSRISYLKNDINKGYVYSLNRGLRQANGKYIARMDSDDISMPDRLLHQFNYMEGHPDVIVCGGGFELFGNVNRVEHLKEDFLLCLLRSAFNHPTTFLRADYFRSRGIFYDEASMYYEDYKLWGEIYEAHHYTSDCFYNLPEVVIKYRTHSLQVSSAFKEQQAAGALQVRRKFLTDFLTKHDMPFRFS